MLAQCLYNRIIRIKLQVVRNVGLKCKLKTSFNKKDSEALDWNALSVYSVRSYKYLKC